MWHNDESCPLCGLKAIFLSTSCIVSLLLTSKVFFCFYNASFWMLSLLDQKRAYFIFRHFHWYIMDQNLVWSRSKASSGLLHWWACSPNPRHLEPRGFAEISPTPGIHRHIYAPLLYMKHLRVYASPGNRMYEVYMAAVLSLAWGLEDWASAWW